MQESLDARFNPIRLHGTKNPSVRTIVKRFLIDRDETVDSKTDQVQTESGRARSRHDLYLVLKNYFPETTIQDACRIFNGLKKQGLITTWHCNEVKRIVSSPSNVATGSTEVGEVIDKTAVNLKAKQRQKPTKNELLLQRRAEKDGSGEKTTDTDNRTKHGRL